MRAVQRRSWEDLRGTVCWVKRHGQQAESAAGRDSWRNLTVTRSGAGSQQEQWQECAALAIGPAQPGSWAACRLPAQISLDSAKQHMSQGIAMRAMALFYSVLLGEVHMRIANRQQGVQCSCSTPDFVEIRPIRGLDPILLF